MAGQRVPTVRKDQVAWNYLLPWSSYLILITLRDSRDLFFICGLQQISKWDCWVALSADLWKNMKQSTQEQELSCLNLLGDGYLNMDYLACVWCQYFRSIFLGRLRKGDVTTAHCDHAGLEGSGVGRTNMSMWCSKPAIGQRLWAERWAEVEQSCAERLCVLTEGLFAETWWWKISMGVNLQRNAIPEVILR